MRRLPLLFFLTAALHSQISVTTTLVQVDAIVTGADGRPVTTLTQDDFEILEDGKPREIRSFSFVRIEGAVAGERAATKAATVAPVTLRRQDVRRTIAIVIDDLKMSVQSLHYTREALRKFIATQVGPDDLVAIQTTGGASPLGQFTTDRKQLRAAVDRIRVNLTGGGPADSIRAIGNEEGDDAQVGAMLRRRFAVGTLGAVRHIAEGMREMPGRKSVVLFSEGMRMARDFVKEEPPVDVNEVRSVSDAANRAAVVIYAIDPRGVVYPGMQAKDDVSGLEQGEVRDQIGERLERLRGTQATLRFLAQETGGLAQLNSNDMNDSLRQVLSDQSGYYLLGFQSGEDAAARLRREGKYHRLQVRVKTPGLRVRHRKGFLGDAAAPAPMPATPVERLLTAITSPFAATGLPLRFTPTFTVGEKGQSVVRALLHIGGGQVTFGPADAEGMRLATLHILAVTEGETRATTQKTYNVRVAATAAERMARGGFVYSLEHEVKRPGAYQMRVAVLDQLSGQTGSASRFVEIPSLGKGAMAISGVSMAKGDLRSQTPEDDDVSPAVRVFARGQMFSYGLTVYNAPMSGDQPAVELRPRLLRGDEVVWQGKPIAVVLRPGMDVRRLPAGGVLTLGEKTPPGEYLLEVQAVETTGKRGVQSQWIDFELR